MKRASSGYSAEGLNRPLLARDRASSAMISPVANSSTSRGNDIGPTRSRRCAARGRCSGRRRLLGRRPRRVLFLAQHASRARVAPMGAVDDAAGRPCPARPRRRVDEPELLDERRERRRTDLQPAAAHDLLERFGECARRRASAAAGSRDERAEQDGPQIVGDAARPRSIARQIGVADAQEDVELLAAAEERPQDRASRPGRCRA